MPQSNAPNTALEFAQHHAHMSHLFLHLLRNMRNDYAPRLALPEFADLCPIVCQVLIGHVEGRAMTAADLARFLEMPRSTVMRRLRLLIALGILERHGAQYWLVRTRNGEAFREFWQHLLYVVGEVAKLEH